MSKIIDTITTLIGVGIIGYFGYTVLLPKLADLKLPSTIAAPQPIAELPSVVGPSDEESSAPMMTAPTPQMSAPPTGGGQVLYDSNKGWTGVSTAASGNPKWTTAAGGVGKLSAGSGHGRVYIAVKNHNARMEGELMFESGAVDNISLRLRSRHQEGGACENRFGGFNASITSGGAVKFQTESCHNHHENSIQGPTVPIQKGQWVKFAYSCYDSPDKKSVNFRFDINGKTVHTGKHPSPKPYYMDEALHMKKSYIWLRSNNSGQGVVAFRNFRIISLSPATVSSLYTQSMMMNAQPYLFDRFYHGRRM